MRNLPNKRNPKQNLIISAVYDYFGNGITAEEKNSVKYIALYLMGRKKGFQLTEEQKSDMWAIRENLGDKVYSESFLQALGG